MSLHINHAQIVDLLPLYVAGALEADEMLALEEYLQNHIDLLAKLDALEQTIVQFAQSAPPAPLPTDGRDRLLARAQHDQSTRTTQTTAKSGPMANITSHPLKRFFQTLRSKPANPSQPLVSTPTMRSQSMPRPVQGWRGLTFTAGVALVAVVLLLLNTFWLQSRIHQLNLQNADLHTTVGELRQINEQIEHQLEDNQMQLASFLHAERSVVMDGTTLAPMALGAFYLDEDQGTVILTGLAPLPSSQTYQLWLVPPDGVPTSVGLLAVTDDGPIITTVRVPEELRDFAIVDVSIEPAGGSANINTGAIVLRGALN